MIATLWNAIRTTKLQKQIANIQETTAKIAALPKIQELINVIDDIARVELSNFENQSKNNIENFKNFIS